VGITFVVRFIALLLNERTHDWKLQLKNTMIIKLDTDHWLIYEKHCNHVENCLGWGTIPGLIIYFNLRKQMEFCYHPLPE